MEVNSLLAFAEMTEKDFESVLRRSCVIPVLARFFDKKYLDKHFPNHEACGVFPRDPELTVKFRDLTYGAGFQLLALSHSENYSQQGMLDQITDYSRSNIDHGITESFMRDSCHLPKGANKMQNTRNMIAGVEVESDFKKAILMDDDENGDASLSPIAVYSQKIL